MGYGRVEGSSAIGGGGEAAIALMSDIDGTHIGLFESLHIGDLPYIYISPNLQSYWIPFLSIFGDFQSQDSGPRGLAGRVRTDRRVGGWCYQQLAVL